MTDCGVGRRENSAATEEEIMDSLRRRAMRVTKAAEIFILQRAVTTADELRKFVEGRERSVGPDKM